MEQSVIKSRQEFDRIVDDASQHIANWINAELKTLSRRQNLILGSTENDVYAIGSLVLLKHRNQNWLVIRDVDDYEVFYSRNSAFCYCLYINNNQIPEANTIKELDRAIAALQNNCDIYNKKMKSCTKDSRYSILLSRYQADAQRINTLKQRLKNLLSIAKYTKIRNFYESNRH